jgi:hypothetical protein
MAGVESVELGLAVLLLASLVALVVLRPLLQGGEEERTEDERRAALEAAKEAKYREIRDAELDFRMGKLSEVDYRATDGELRAQAIAILRQLDELDSR